MATSFSFRTPILLFLCSLQCMLLKFHAQIDTLPDPETEPLILQITKDPSTSQYFTTTLQRNFNSNSNSLTPTKLLLHLGGPFLWLHCSSPKSIRSFHQHSLHCLAANPIPKDSLSNPNPSNLNPICSLTLQNPITKASAIGDLTEGSITAVRSSDVLSTVDYDQFLFSCAPKSLLHGLASGVNGVLGFGRSRISVPSQISPVTGSGSRRFSMCLSSSNGVIISGDDQLLARRGSEAPIPLTYTPLVKSNSSEYFISIKSIKINNKRLSLNSSSTHLVQLSTTAPYTVMKTSIYSVFAGAYRRAAAAGGMKEVDPVGPFGVCFREIGPGGFPAPEIDLVLQSEMVKWRIGERSSMVRVREGVMCLGFLDGGEELGAESEAVDAATIVIGGFQLEDVLVTVDEGSFMLGFSGSLLEKKTSCAELAFPAHTSV